jgi:3-hydroxybutyrate dehydrogenase
MLNGKTAIVTGSTSGIGLGVARALAAAGARIMLNGFGDAEHIEALRSGMQREFGTEVAYNGADMSKPEQIHAMVSCARDQLGSVDILVNNAGIQHTCPIESFATDKWDAIIAINLSSAFHTMKAVVPGMRARGWGRIVNIASVHGLVASVNKAAYLAAKHGLVGLSKGVALETAPQGITVNCICPGWTDTVLIQPQIDAKAAAHGGDRAAGIRDLVREKQPNLTLLPPERIGDIAVFLCSDAAAGITGVALPVDGGWTAQ